MKITTLDTTLRDGAQSEHISFSLADKIKIVKLLDSLGIDFIEAGNPASNVKDEEFFRAAAELKLSHSQLVAFGSTRRADVAVEQDRGLGVLLRANTAVVSVFGKASASQVAEVLRTSRENNLAMIFESVEYLTKHGRSVIFDAEHFFDGYKEDAKYAMEVLGAARDAGALWLVLCDTNGGAFIDEVYEITKAVTARFENVGIHTHNDSGLAVGTSLMAVKAGAAHVQGTINGIGERCGNANLGTLIANLQLKRGYELIDDRQMQNLAPVSRAIADISNITISGMPYVSRGAFAHKGGMHIDAVSKLPQSFEHISPSLVGNERSILISDLSGKSALLPILRRFMPDMDKSSPYLEKATARLKDLEFIGYQFEAAQASLEIELRKVLGLHRNFFDIERFRIMIEQDSQSADSLLGYSSAYIKVRVGEESEITAADSNGPVHAIDIALRKALERFYPRLCELKLTDYKVRVLDSSAATGASVRVLIESTDGSDSWITVGVSTDIIMASKKALVDSIEYKLIKDQESGGK